MVWKQRLSTYIYHFQHPAWGLPHIRRVLEMALHLAEAEKIPFDQEALIAAAYLHDIGSFKPYQRKGRHHGESSVEVVEQLLTMVGFPMEKLDLVKCIIGGHMYYSDPGDCPEAVVFHDADTLDFMGAIGIARLLSIVGIDDWTPDLPSAVRRIESLSRELPGRLHTPTAKAIGQERQQEMATWLGWLHAESEELHLL